MEYVDTWELSQASVTLIQCAGRIPSGATFWYSADYCRSLVFLHDNCLFFYEMVIKSGLQLFVHTLENLINPFTSVLYIPTEFLSAHFPPFHGAKGFNYLF